MYRNIKIARGGASASPDAVAVCVFKDTKKLPGGYKQLDESADGALAKAIGRPEFDAGVGSVTALYPAAGAKRLYVLGIGDGTRPFDAVRIAAAKLAGALHGAGVKRAAVHVAPAFEALGKDGPKFDGDAAGRAVGEGLALGNFSFDDFKGIVSKKDEKDKGKAAELTVDVQTDLRAGATRGLVVGEAANVARQFAATPPNVANPGYLVKECKKMATQAGLKCTVIDQQKAKQHKMGGLLAVGSAGSTPPALICLEHKPTVRGGGKNKMRGKSPRNTPTILLVGKAITFDTGGYSIKPSAGMLGMKYDKCGGMAVIGAMRAAAALNLPVRVVGLIAAAENMINDEAYRPNDILTMHNGVTVEVTNTDAEGRLVLADALSYGCKTYKPDAVIDLATLTGGVVVALGGECAGAFVNDSDLREHLFDAAEASGERLWHLPMWDEYKPLMKGNHSDIINSSPKREAHAIQGAIFLSYFVAKDGDFKKNDPVPWAHLDIAGVAEYDYDTALFPKGPTGYGVRLLIKALETWK